MASMLVRKPVNKVFKVFQDLKVEVPVLTPTKTADNNTDGSANDFIVKKLFDSLKIAAGDEKEVNVGDMSNFKLQHYTSILETFEIGTNGGIATYSMFNTKAIELRA